MMTGVRRFLYVLTPWIQNSQRSGPSRTSIMRGIGLASVARDDYHTVGNVSKGVAQGLSEGQHSLAVTPISSNEVVE